MIDINQNSALYPHSNKINILIFLPVFRLTVSITDPLSRVIKKCSDKLGLNLLYLIIDITIVFSMENRTLTCLMLDSSHAVLQISKFYWPGENVKFMKVRAGGLGGGNFKPPSGGSRGQSPQGKFYLFKRCQIS